MKQHAELFRDRIVAELRRLDREDIAVTMLDQGCVQLTHKDGEWRGRVPDLLRALDRISASRNGGAELIAKLPATTLETFVSPPPIAAPPTTT